MRTAKTLSISIPAAEFKRLEELAAKQSRTVDQLAFDALLEYRENREFQDPVTLAEAVGVIQEDAKAKGLHKLSKRIINAEIAAARSEIQVSKPRTFAEALELVREDSERKGLNKLTMREINKEIAAYRQDKVSRKLDTHTLVGQTPSSAPDPWSGSAITRDTAIDVGVDQRSRGTAPHRHFSDERV